MRKFVALLFVTASFIFVACEQKSETTTEISDTVTVPNSPAADPGVDPIAPDTLSADSANAAQ